MQVVKLHTLIQAQQIQSKNITINEYINQNPQHNTKSEFHS